MSASLAYRADIDGLRAVSVVAVVLFHLGVGGVPGGFVGVDVFFVISGHLITSIIAREIDRGAFTFAGFYERRIRRIFPALIVVLAATLAAAWVVVMPRDFLAFARTLIAAPLFAANFMFLGGDGYFDPGSLTKPLLHTWSLGVEEQFYIVFPWLLLAATRLLPGRRTAVVAAAVLLSFAGSVVAGLLGSSSAYFLLPTRFFELGIGALTALGRPVLAPSTRAGLGIVGLAAILAACLLFDETIAFPGWAAAIPCLGAAGVILGESGPAARLLALPPIVHVGRISYPMYLWHWPPIVLVTAVTGRPIDAATAAVLFVFTVIAAEATLRLVETPIRSRRVFAARRTLFAASAAASAGLVAIGVVGVATRGWPGRFPAEVAALAAAANERPSLDAICPQGRRDMGKDLPPCVIGDTGRPRVDFAVLGDSHSRALAGEIGAAAKAAGLEGLFLGRIACPPLLHVDRPGDRTRRCAEHLDWALGRIRTVDPAAVVIAARWTVATDATLPLGERIAAAGGDVGGDGESGAELMRRGLAATLDALGADRRVVLVAGVPEPGFDVPMGLAADALFGRPLRPGPLRAVHDRRQAVVRGILEAVAAGRPNVVVVDPAAALCPGRRCDVLRDGRPLYVDDDHPSRLGAALVARPIVDALAGATR